MATELIIKQHDTRPIRTLTLTEQNPTKAAGVTQAVNLGAATSAKLAAVSTSDPTQTIVSQLAFYDVTGGILKWTPVAGDTAKAGTFRAEVEVTWNDGGIETFPNDGYITIVILGDIG